MQDPPSPALALNAEAPPESDALRHPSGSEMPSLPPGSRVCDVCISKKVKCDLGRPACSPCLQRGYTCTYSSVRRRPGPARGSRRGARRAQTSHARQHQSINHQPSNEESPTLETTPIPPSITSYQSSTPAGSEPSQGTSGTEHLTHLDILPEEEEELIVRFFDVVHNAVPIFSKSRFMLGFKDSLYSRDLVLTILIITAKLTGFNFASSRFDLDARIDFMLSSASLQEDMCGDSISLDEFRKACLLAFYEFHQFPGQQAWMRTGKLTRLAYWIGLDCQDRIGRPRGHDLDPSTMQPHDAEDWRLVWWFVYRLDTYVNLASGTPYLVDEMLVKTALVLNQHLDDQPESQQSSQNAKLFLPPHQDGLWELIPAITSNQQQRSLFNLHIITSTATRYVGRALQTCMLGPSPETFTSLADAERRLSTLRLALPANYFNPTRNAFSNETRPDHHARLITVLHLLMSRLLIVIMRCYALDEGQEWLMCWQQVLEICQDIASISEQWNSAFSLSVDPAMSFIIFTALIFVDLHKKFVGFEDPSLIAGLENCEVVLLLLLEQFANIWTLPRLLILSFKGFRESMRGPLSYSDIQSILDRFEAPLHPRWIRFLSTASANHDT